MDIYRVTTEKGFECEMLDSALFSEECTALDYAQNLANERRDTEDYAMCYVAVARLTPDNSNEFQFAGTLICHEL